MIKIGSSTLLLLALLAVQLPSSFCQDWWSLVTRSAVINPSDVTSPISQSCSNPNLFDGILCGKQIDICKRDNKLLSTIAIGILRSLNVCQRLFKDRAWNCSVFDSQMGPYLGRFIEQGTRETAYLNALISAGISREVARKCKEQNLQSCACDFTENIPADLEVEADRIIPGCGDNCDYGVKVAEDFTNCGQSDDSCTGLAALHNNKVGREMVMKDAEVDCVCHGLSGSCSVQTCFKKVPDIEDIGEKLYKKYDIAKQVEKDSSNSLIPANAYSPELRSTELGYCASSPSFCKRNLTQGIYGTSGRQCWPDREGPSNCNVLCCGGEVVQKVVTKVNETCNFVWCCRVECKVVNYYNVTEYYCK